MVSGFEEDMSDEGRRITNLGRAHPIHRSQQVPVRAPLSRPRGTGRRASRPLHRARLAEIPVTCGLGGGDGST